jgi:DNA helicase-2/ATP-dependent DNA helicase PcrA
MSSQTLNAAQEEAVHFLEGPLLVVAGAGTGKTRVITERIAYMIKSGIAPGEILAITFTNKAATEMRERVEGLVGKCGVSLCTYHSFCARFLRSHAVRAGFTRDYSIYDRSDCLALMKRILSDRGLEKNASAATKFMDLISSFKQEALSPREILETALSPKNRETAEIYKIYDTHMRLANAMDFDDLLVKTVALLKDDESLRRETENRYRYLLIDEYQDTNRLQYEIVRLIGAHGNVCATGDPDQSIYAWRGADIRNILEFEKDMPNARVVLLEENYRSSGCILKAASSVIDNNRRRKKRSLWTQQDDGEPLLLLVVDNEKEEARSIAQRILFRREEGLAWQQQAVFYRTNAQTRILERVFREKNIPYRLVGALSFFQRREVKDLLAYLNLLNNPRDDQCFLRVINTPKRGLGKSTLDKLIEEARRRGVSLMELSTCSEALAILNKRARRRLEAFFEMMQELVAIGEKASVRDLLMEVIDQTVYERYLQEDPEGSERLENVKELVSAARDFDMGRPGASLRDFLEEVSLLSSTELSEGDERGVTLMTLHSAKGLEFDHVYFAGLEEELMPHARSFGDPEAIEEERRLMYVGITRARKSLTLLRAETRSQWGQTRFSRASRFLAEIPEAVLEVEDKTQPSPALEEKEDTEISQNFFEDEFSQVAPELPIAPGDRVRHRRFGAGDVLTVSGRCPALRVRIRFPLVGVRQLIWDKAPLEKL